MAETGPALPLPAPPRPAPPRPGALSRPGPRPSPYSPGLFASGRRWETPGSKVSEAVKLGFIAPKRGYC